MKLVVLMGELACLSLKIPVSHDFTETEAEVMWIGGGNLVLMRK